MRLSFQVWERTWIAMAMKKSGKAAHAAAATTTSTNEVVGRETVKKPKKTKAAAAHTDDAKKITRTSASKPKRSRPQAKLATKATRKTGRQSHADSVRRLAAPPEPAALMGFSGPEAIVAPSPALPRGQHRSLGVIAGSADDCPDSKGPTADLQVGATDLCEIAPSGRVAVAGDTWEGRKAFSGVWSPSLALHVSSLAGAVKFDKSFGFGKLDEHGWHHLYQDGWSEVPEVSRTVGPN